MKKEREKTMIGFYDYTVILTYASVVSAVAAIGLCMAPHPHPYYAVFLLMLSGLCDAFDGRVARMKKDRTKMMKNFGIQIDSLADVVAFGVAPVFIGLAFHNRAGELGAFRLPFAVVVVISALYILAAVIRLAYFNVTEDELQASGVTKREFYSGLPVTSAALIFPTIVLIQFLVGGKFALTGDMSWLYHCVMLFTAFAFVGKFKLRKPGFKGVMIMVGIGLAEAAMLLIFRFVVHHG